MIAPRTLRSIKQPLREGRLDFYTRWNGPDNGLILCWENGRRQSIDQPELTAKAKNGELPILVWTGGVTKKLKGKKEKLGSWYYMATWQGLRGEDLDITPDNEITMICSKTGQAVTFSSRRPIEDEEEE